MSGKEWKALLRACRPKQWIKNGLVFAAPLFAFAISTEILTALLFTFFVFCGVSSGTYLLNDLFDLSYDRLHPLKRKRPLASGHLSLGVARTAAVLLIVLSLAASWPISPWLSLIAGFYVVLQILYNLLFKHVLILDIMTLATGFVLRAVAGAATARVDLSPWFLFCVALLAFYIVLEKRKGELRRKDDSGITTRKILDSYSIPYLRQVETAVLAALLVGYALWTIQGAETAWMMLTVPFVLYGILRYQLLSEKEIVERPEDLLFRDRPLLLNVFLWLVSCFLILALQRFGF